MPPKKKVLDRPNAASGNEGARAVRLIKERDVLRKFRVIFSSANKHFRSVERQCGVSGSREWALIEI